MTTHKKCQMPDCHNTLGNSRNIIKASNPELGFGHIEKIGPHTVSKICRQCGKSHSHGKINKFRVCNTCYKEFIDISDNVPSDLQIRTSSR
jgi:hypothetical protein